MKHERKVIMWRVMAVVLLLCQLSTYMPVYVAEAAGPQNFIAPEHSTGQITNKGFHLSAYEYYADGSLDICNTYHYEPGHVTTYYGQW